MVGPVYLPKVTLSSIPNVVDLSNSKKVTKFLGQNEFIKKSDVDKELSEGSVINGVKDYFQLHNSYTICLHILLTFI